MGKLLSRVMKALGLERQAAVPAETAEVALARKLQALPLAELIEIKNRPWLRPSDQSQNAHDRAGEIDEANAADKEIRRRVSAMPDTLLEALLANDLSGEVASLPETPFWPLVDLREENLSRQHRKARSEESERRQEARFKISQKSDAELSAELEFTRAILANKPKSADSIKSVTDLVEEVERRRSERRRKDEERSIDTIKIASKSLRTSDLTLLVLAMSLIVAILSFCSAK